MYFTVTKFVFDLFMFTERVVHYNYIYQISNTVF